MTTAPARTARGRSARGRRGEGTYDERRDALAASALLTLGELGYARTSLRDIAANSEFSHGVVHYYFRDKTELIVYCVRYYKATCVRRYDDVIEQSDSVQALADAFAAKLAETLVDDAAMHRLWYDLRTQSMFEEPLREAVLGIDATLEDMIWRVVERYAELSGRTPTVTSRTAYVMLDGVFESALLYHLSGRAEAVEELQQRVLDIVPRLFCN